MSRQRTPRARLRSLAGALLACATVAVAGLGAAPVPASASARAAFCIPIILPCSTPGSTPTPTPTPSGTLPGIPGVPGVPGAPGSSGTPTPTPTATPAPVAPSGPDAGATVFTQPPAQLGSRSLSFTGLPGISVVTVPLADGSRTTVLKLTADSITIQGFSLTVRKQTGPSLATTADTMTLKGHVQVYLDSITATDANGHSYTLGADTPPPNDGLPPQLLRVTLGLVGATADSIVYTNTKQHLSE